MLKNYVDVAQGGFLGNKLFSLPVHRQWPDRAVYRMGHRGRHGGESGERETGIGLAV